MLIIIILKKSKKIKKKTILKGRHFTLHLYYSNQPKKNKTKLLNLPEAVFILSRFNTTPTFQLQNSTKLLLSSHFQL